jgi:hypothetical protein
MILRRGSAAGDHVLERSRLFPFLGGARGPRPERGERGSSLILALVFVIFVGGAIAALADFVMNNISNTAHFASARNLQYAASSTTNFAVGKIRYTPLLSTTLNASPPAACWGSGTLSDLTNIDGVSQMDVWCSTSWTPTSSATRVVTLSVCEDGASVTAQSCAASPLLQAVVTFDDYPSGATAPNPNACVVYCGTGMTIDSWAWSPTVPVVSSVSVVAPATSPITSAGGARLSISGSGFVNGATVNFVEESGNVVASDNTVLQATTVQVNSSSSITATAPPILEGATYYVTVTSSTGTSPYLNPTSGSYMTVTYAPQTPTVSNVTPTGGATAGGTDVTITGSGFFSGATVQFEEESGGSGSGLLDPIVSRSASNVVVVNSTTVTAVAPGITTGNNLYYEVFVTNPGVGQSVSTTQEFNYTVFFPIVFAISPTGGPKNTSMTIYGTNFLVGSTVNFDPVGGGATLSGSITSITPTQILVNVPSTVTSGKSYDVTVTVAGNPTTNTSVFTAS